MERKKIAIVGVGLIGGSLALQLNEKGLAAGIIGVEADPLHAKKALDLRLVDEIKDLKQDCRRPYDDTAEIRYLYEDKHRNKEILWNNGLPDIVISTSAYKRHRATRIYV